MAKWAESMPSRARLGLLKIYIGLRKNCERNKQLIQISDWPQVFTHKMIDFILSIWCQS